MWNESDVHRENTSKHDTQPWTWPIASDALLNIKEPPLQIITGTWNSNLQMFGYKLDDKTKKTYQTFAREIVFFRSCLNTGNPVNN